MCPCPKIDQDLCDIYQTTIYKSPGEDLLLEADIGNIKVNASTRIAQYQEDVTEGTSKDCPRTTTGGDLCPSSL